MSVEYYKALLEYVTDEPDVILLRAIVDTGSVKHGRELLSERGYQGYSKRNTSRRLKAISDHAIMHGFNPSQPDASYKTDMPIYAKSTYRKFDPPLDDGTIGEWTKVKSRDVEMAEILASMIQGINTKPAKPSPVFKDETTDKILPILTLADVHLELLASEGETGKSWGMEQMSNLIRHSIDYLVDKMEYTDEAHFVDLGDLTHSDGLKAVTPRSKHHLDVSHRYFDACREAKALCRYGINRMLEKAKTVHVFIVRGNHNEQTAWHINEELTGIYENEPRVINYPNDSYHLMREWGKNLCVMTHGEIRKNRDLYAMITSKWRAENGRVNHVYVQKGHVHHERTEVINHMRFEHFGNMNPGDVYTHHNLYGDSRAMHLVNLRWSGGEATRATIDPLALEEWAA